MPSPNPQTKLDFSDDREVRLVGKSSLALDVRSPGQSHQPPLSRTKNAGIPLAGKTELVFWVKMINTNVHAWKGLMPTVTLYESPTKFCELRPYDDCEELAGRHRLDLQVGAAARQRGVEAQGRGPRDAELDDHRVLSLGRRAVPRLDRRHGDQVISDYN